MKEETANTCEEQIGNQRTQISENRRPSYSEIVDWNATSPYLGASNTSSTWNLLRQEEPPQIRDYTLLSIFTMLFCCLIIGVAALIPASEAKYLKRTDPRKAKVQADMSRNLNIFGIACGIGAYIYLIVRCVMIANKIEI